MGWEALSPFPHLFLSLCHPLVYFAAALSPTGQKDQNKRFPGMHWVHGGGELLGSMCLVGLIESGQKVGVTLHTHSPGNGPPFVQAADPECRWGG